MDDNCASPNITATTGCILSLILNHAFSISDLNFFVLFSNLIRKSFDEDKICTTSEEIAAIAGIRLFENKYHLCWLRSFSTTCFFETIKPPLAPPKAFPMVEDIISTLHSTPHNSAVPLPFSQTNHVA